MAHLSGNFSDLSPGRLLVTLRGVFTQTQRRDAGFPGGSNDMLLRASINGWKTPCISRETPTVTMTILGYPGGSVAWPLYTEVVATAAGGTSFYGFRDLELEIFLIKNK